MVQSQHAVADFSSEYPENFNIWKIESNSIISLSVKDEDSLLNLYNKLSKFTNVSIFHEPDIDDQATSICLIGDSKIRKKLAYLPLSLKERKEVLS